MASAQRLSILAGTVAALVFLFILLQSTTQVAKARASPEDPTYQEGTKRQFAPGEIIVTLDQSASQSDLAQLNQQNDASTEDNLPQSKVNVVDLPSDFTVSEGILAYEDSPDVAYAEPNFKLYPTETPNDSYFSRMWALNNAGQTGGTIDADIDAPEQWNTNTGSPLTAVIDEGMDINHPDLKANIYTNPGELPGNGRVDDNNRYVDDVHGYDFANNEASVYDPDPITGRGDEHGTHVAGTIAAVGDKGTGVTGVNWQAKIMPLKFLGPNGGYTSDAVEALDYAVKNPALTLRDTSSSPLSATAERTVSATTMTSRRAFRPTTQTPISSPSPRPTTATSWLPSPTSVWIRSISPPPVSAS